MSDRLRLSDTARGDLLGLARAALEAHFRGEPAPRLASDRSEAFGQPRGLFVTLRVGEELRGCIGTLAPDGNLAGSIPRYARAAALEDPLFPPLQPSELARCTIEISVLSAPRRVEDVLEIEVGRDGLIIEAGGRRGLLLPQVATEWGFDRERFLAEVARKAGLPPEAVRAPGTTLWAFQAEVFSEGPGGSGDREVPR
ncbi:MAG: AmmeMemoRadiSam system protein A [Thermoanaerobaculia bacterium]